MSGRTEWNKFTCVFALLSAMAVLAFAVQATAVKAAPAHPPLVALEGPQAAVEGASLQLRVVSHLPRRFRPIHRYSLSFGDGTKALHGKKIPRHASHVYRRAGRFTAKLTVIDATGHSRSARLTIVVRPLQDESPTPKPPLLPQPPPLEKPVPPLSFWASEVELAPGSVATVESPEPVESITQVDSVSGGPPDLSASLQEEHITVSAGTDASPQSATLTVIAEGCVGGECEREVEIWVPLTVRSLAAPYGSLEEFTAPSPDRIAEAEALPEGGVRLLDELIVTFGTPNEPGWRGEAEEAAAAVGATLSGGIEELGVFEFRWESPQDLEQRRTELLGWPGVTAVSDSTLDVVGEDALPPGDWSDDGPQATWSFTATRAPQAWDVTQGSGVTVGIVDAGQVFGGHEDLDVVKKLGNNAAALHATHVAGTACAEANGIGLVGFAWGCPIVTSGWGDRSDKGILEAATAVAKEPGVKVINMSLGYPSNGCASESVQEKLIEEASEYKAEFRQLFRGAIGRDIVWTVSAGNNCAPGVPSPWGLNSDLGNVIAVAATNSDGELASFSDFGPGVEVAAPGGVSVSPIGNGTVGIWSTIVQSCFVFFKCGGYAANLPNGAPIAGTSMAAPAVAGIAALVRSAHPGLNASQAAGCIVRGAGKGTGTATSRSSLPAGASPKASYSPATLRIVDAEAAVACESGVVFDGSPGTGPPPPTLGSYPMTSFGPDPQPEGEVVSSVEDPAGTVEFWPPATHLLVPSSWATWSHEYTGDVYMHEGESTLELTLPPGTKAFSFYAEPDAFQTFTVEAIAQDGTSSGQIDVEGYAGAKYFGFYGTPGNDVASIQISAADPSGFAIGEFQISP